MTDEPIPTLFGVEPDEPQPTLPPPPSPPAAAPVPTPEEKPKKKRWKKILLWTGGIFLGLFLLVLIFAPMIISSIIKKQIIAQVPEHLNATAEVESTPFSWPCHVQINKLVIKDLGGKPVFAVDKVDVRVGLLAAIGGSYIADVDVTAPTVTVRPNLMSIMKPAPPPTPSSTSSGPSKPKEKKPLPTVKAKIRVAGGLVTVVGPTGETKINNLATSIDVDTFDKPVTFDVSFATAPSGKASITGSCIVGPDPEAMAGSVKIEMHGIDFAPMTPAAAAYAAITDLGGTLDASMAYKIEPGMKISGGGKIEVNNFIAAGEIVGKEPVKLPSVKSTHTVAIDAKGTGRQEFTIDAGDFLHAELAGTTKDLTTDGSFDGRIKADANLRGLSDSLTSLLKLKEGYRLNGTASIGGKVAATMGKSADVDVTAKILDLSPIDAKGKAIPMGADKDVTIAVKGSYDQATETATLTTCTIQSGSIQLDASGGAEKTTIKDSHAILNANLDQLSSEVSAFMDLPFTFGGKVTMDSRLSGSEKDAKSVTRIDVKNFALTMDNKKIGPLDIVLTETARINLQRGGKCILEKFDLKSGLVDMDATGEATDVTRPSDIAGSATWNLKIFPAAINAKLAPFLEGYTLDGKDLTSTGDATFRGMIVDLKGKLLATDLTVRGPAVKSVKVTDTVASWAVKADCGKMSFDLNSVALTLGAMSAELPGAPDVYTVKGLMTKLTGRVASRDTFFAVQLDGDCLVAEAGTKSPTMAIVATKMDLRFVSKLDTETFDLLANPVTFKCPSVQMTGTGAPAVITGIDLTLNAIKVKDDAELREFKFTSSIATGEGGGVVRKLMKEGMTVEGLIKFNGNVAPLVDLAKGFAPDLKTTASSGTWELGVPAESKGTSITLKPALKIKAISLKGKYGETPIDMDPADIKLDSLVAVDSNGVGRADIKSCALTAPGADVSATGWVGGFLAKPAMQLEGSIDTVLKLIPAEINTRLKAFLLGNQLAGDPVNGTAKVTIKGDVYGATGKLTAPNLVITMPPAPVDPKIKPPPPPAKAMVITQKKLVVDFDVMADTAKSKYEVRSCSLSSDTAKATAKGLIDLADESDLSGSFEADLATVMKDFALESKEMSLKGKSSGKFKVYGKKKLGLEADAQILDFEQTASGITIKDPKVTFKMVADLLLETYDLNLVQCDITSAIANGGMKGEILQLHVAPPGKAAPEFKALKGEFTYIPSKVGALLKPIMPGELRGDNPEKINFTLDGKASELDTMAILRALHGNANAGLGNFVMNGLNAMGAVDMKFNDGLVTTDNNLKVNEGGIAFKGAADFRKGGTGTFFDAGINRVRLNADMGPILMLFHPFFAKAATTAGDSDGWINSNIRVTVGTPLTMDLLTAGWGPFPKSSINGEGRIEISELKLTNSILLSQLSENLGTDTRDMKLQPLVFTIQKGRLVYSQPWMWKISGMDTTFFGSIGLDAESKDCLNLTWRLPVTDALVGKVPQLKILKGKSFDLDIKGAAASPRVQWKEFIADMVKAALKEEAKNQLDNLLGKDDKKAKNLLEDADALYNQGKKAEAAEKYKKLHDDYSKTKPYKENKDRIRQRMNEK